MKLALSVLAAVIWHLCTAGAFAQEMAFRLVPAGDPAKCTANCLLIIAAEGEITDATPDKFFEFVRGNRSNSQLRSVILFHSPGGKVAASVKLGLILRKLGAATVVARAIGSDGDLVRGFGAGRCYSACVYALMGGKKRVVPPSSEVGIHRSFIARYGDEPKRENLDAQPKADPELTLKVIGQYSEQMGVSRGLIEQAQRTSPTSIHILTRAEIARWRLAGEHL